MIIITGSVMLHPDRREDAIALGMAHSQRSRSEPGCIAHNCLVDTENPDRLVFLEEWADMAAVKTHFAVPESGEFVRQLASMAIEPPAIRIFTAELKGN